MAQRREHGGGEHAASAVDAATACSKNGAALHLVLDDLPSLDQHRRCFRRRAAVLKDTLRNLFCRSPDEVLVSNVPNDIAVYVKGDGAWVGAELGTQLLGTHGVVSDVKIATFSHKTLTPLCIKHTVRRRGGVVLSVFIRRSADIDTPLTAEVGWSERCSTSERRLGRRLWRDRSASDTVDEGEHHLYVTSRRLCIYA